MTAGFLLITFTFLLIYPFNSLTNNDLFYEIFRTKNYVRKIKHFMQNKPKLPKPKTTITYCTQRTYKDFIFSEPLKNKPKTNPKLN